MVTLEQAKIIQTKTKASADKLLSSFKIKRLLSQFGQAELEGAYSYDLMVKRDIDLKLINPLMNELLAHKLLELLKSQDFIKSIRFVDENRPNRREGAPRGYYFGLLLDYENLEWKIDVWLVADNIRGKNYPKTLRDKNWISNCTQKQKDSMLLIKAQLYEESGDYFAAKIYQAVLESDVTNLQEFKKWQSIN